MHAVTVAQQHVQLTQGVPGLADRQVGRQQLHARGVLHGKLPQAFVIQAQAPGACQAQPMQQGAAVLVQAPEPLLQGRRLLHPVTAGQGVTLWPGRLREHRRGEDHPRQVPHCGMTQLTGQRLQVGKRIHGPSIAVSYSPRDPGEC